MKKKTERKKLTDKLDSLCREIILKRDNNICQKCGTFAEKQNAHCSHVIPRSQGNILRWNLLNLKLLCFHCHINWWHKSPCESGEWFKSKFPDRWEYLQEKKNEVIKFSISDLKDLEKKLKFYLTND